MTPPPRRLPTATDNYYTEGNGLQYTYSVPHDVDGLRKLFASDAAYVSLLQQQMVSSARSDEAARRSCHTAKD